jgi:putative hydrolase of the HAD superfamily
MKRARPITTLFLDIGGVLLTDGWGHKSRARTARAFGLDAKELETRHQHAFAAHELGKLSLADYMSRVVFYQKQPFTRAQFRKAMFAQSQPYPQMIELVRKLKGDSGLKIVVVSNEGRELNAYRIRKFKLDELVDSFVSSCYVGLRKPDPNIFRLALDISQVPARKILYLENTAMFVEVAQGLGIRSILHTDYRSTCAEMASLGLRIGDPAKR